ncbi:hypothetical protein RRG08_053883 [Elysia crispata]|uniref:Uncharacterized protein n=1 Tax=Elysia crispata TaxID=231223 RepID=A0AAE1D125_9GAST|nr:hypothetical protein RRG08_053883 [Elysia crispata]
MKMFTCYDPPSAPPAVCTTPQLSSQVKTPPIEYERLAEAIYRTVGGGGRDARNVTLTERVTNPVENRCPERGKSSRLG